MIRKSIATIALLMFSVAVIAQNKISDWPELKTFHGVMSTTFHPSEEGNLAPIKERAGEMLDKAVALQASKAPEAFATEKIKSAVNRLVAGSKELKMIVDQKQADDVITKKLAALHDVFHEIVGLCVHGEGEKHEHKDDDGHKH